MNKFMMKNTTTSAFERNFSLCTQSCINDSPFVTVLQIKRICILKKCSLFPINCFARKSILPTRFRGKCTHRNNKTSNETSIVNAYYYQCGGSGFIILLQAVTKKVF